MKSPQRARLEAGETLLVHGAGGGVGYAAVQIGRSLGATVIAVTSGTERAAVVRAAGAHRVVDRHREDVVAQVRAIVGGQGVDAILDPVGGAALAQAQRVVAVEGRIIVVGFASGEIPAPTVNHLLLRNYSVGGFRTRRFRDSQEYRREVHDALCAMYSRGEIRPRVREVPFAAAPQAIGAIGRGDVTGRVVCVR